MCPEPGDQLDGPQRASIDGASQPNRAWARNASTSGDRPRPSGGSNAGARPRRWSDAVRASGAQERHPPSATLVAMRRGRSQCTSNDAVRVWNASADRTPSDARNKDRSEMCRCLLGFNKRLQTGRKVVFRSKTVLSGAIAFLLSGEMVPLPRQLTPPARVSTRKPCPWWGSTLTLLAPTATRW